MKKILVLDDSPFMLKVISDILTGLNYDVTTVDNGKSACEQVNATRFDLIITDMNMPNMDGLEFTKQVRTLPNSRFVPILMLSSEEDSEKIAMARKMGISTFLSKPPQESQLQNILQLILNKRSSLRVPVQLKVTWGANAEYSGVTSNISTGGLFVETATPLSLGNKVVLSLPLPGSEVPLSCPVQVSWTYSNDERTKQTHPTGMGLEFLDQNHQSEIKAYLKTVG